MTTDKIIKINTNYRAAAWAFGVLFAGSVTIFWAGGFYKTTSDTNKSVPLLREEILGVKTELHNFIAVIYKKFDRDSIRDIQKKEDELKYKKEINKVAESCVQQ